jgi:uncharacterized protein
MTSAALSIPVLRTGPGAESFPPENFEADVEKAVCANANRPLL